MALWSTDRHKASNLLTKYLTTAVNARLVRDQMGGAGGYLALMKRSLDHAKEKGDSRTGSEHPLILPATRLEGTERKHTMRDEACRAYRLLQQMMSAN